MTALAEELPTPRFAAVLRQYGGAAVLVAAMLALALAAAVSLVVNGSGFGFDSPAPRLLPRPEVQRLRAAAEATSATELRQVAPQDALAINAAIPLSGAANPAARPFVWAGGTAADRARSLDCLTAAIYYEAAREPTDGQRAVAQVVLNRVRHPAYPDTVCGVVFEGATRITGCQFSFTCDGSLRRAPIQSYWDRARQVAEAALDGYVYAPVGWATHYHANYVVPYWSSTLVKVANIGAHIFYRWTGGWGRAPAFADRYAGTEPVIRWRGGFGQPTAEERAEAGDRDALAAAAAANARLGSVDSFANAVLRRYEAPITHDNANAIIAARAAEDPNMTNSQRWALTGQSASPPQRPLGRWAPPADDHAPPPPTLTPPSPAQPAPAAAPTPRAAGTTPPPVQH
jgi:spore germination cell wall hydrolase CwlJ-like protein